MSFDLKTYLSSRKDEVEKALAYHLETYTPSPPTLRESMSYSLLAGGKRLRPILCVAACEAVGGTADLAMDAACAVEFIHTYSLIHDDLPAMDDDDFRRGRPTNHKVYGEAIAVLAGDALCAEAFRVLTKRRQRHPERVAEVVFELGCAAGANGMVGGQVWDIEATGKKIDQAYLENLHRAKTGELLLFSVRAGAILGGATPDQLERLTTYGRALGLAFQVIDDVLDVTADLATLGKDPGSDREAGKQTFVDILGVEEAKQYARTVMARGIEALTPLGAAADALRALASYTVDRDR